MSIENKEYTCEKCNFKTQFKNSYKTHLKSELHITGKRKPRKDKQIQDKCPHCLYTTKIKTSMDTHIIKHHMTQEEQKEKLTFYCDYCKIGTLSNAQHERHLNSTKHKNKLIYLGLAKKE